MLEISWDKFMSRFKPETTNGETLLPRDWQKDGDLLSVADSENRCWTLIADPTGVPYIESGSLAETMTLHYVITKKPHYGVIIKAYMTGYAD